MSELDDLARVFVSAGDGMDDAAFEEIRDAAKVIRDDWRAQWSGFRSAPYLARAVTFDVFRLGGSVSAEIGPDKQRRQGALGNLLEFGSVHNAPRPAGGAALARGVSGLEDRIADRAAELLEGGNG